MGRAEHLLFSVEPSMEHAGETGTLEDGYSSGGGRQQAGQTFLSFVSLEPSHPFPLRRTGGGQGNHLHLLPELETLTMGQDRHCYNSPMPLHCGPSLNLNRRLILPVHVTCLRLYTSPLDWTSQLSMLFLPCG